MVKRNIAATIRYQVSYRYEVILSAGIAYIGMVLVSVQPHK